MVYQDKKSSLEAILKLYKSSSIHNTDLQYMATELCSPETMKEVFLFLKKIKFKV